MRPRSFFGDAREGMACGICGVTHQFEDRVVLFPCRPVLHARCVADILARGTAPAPLCFPTVNCGAQHQRRDALEIAVQVDPGLRNRAGRMRGGIIGDEDLRSGVLWHGWDQNVLAIGPTSRHRLVRRSKATFRNRQQSTPAVGRRKRTPER